MELIRNGETRTAKAISPPWTLSNMKARKDGDLDFHTAPELCMDLYIYMSMVSVDVKATLKMIMVIHCPSSGAV